MKNIFLIALATSSLAVAKVETLKLDPVQSKVTWLASKKVGSTHNGTVALKSGEVALDGDQLKSGKLVVDMTKITVDDIPATDSNHAKLKGHLESEDFFSIKSSKEATLIIKSAKKDSATKSTVTADLTIKGKTHPVTFPVEITKTDKGTIAKGKITVDRTKYDIKYNSADFFNLPVDKIINNTFDISFEVLGSKI